MSIDRIVLAFAGFMILASLLLGLYVSPYWFWFTAFVGANLFPVGVHGLLPAGGHPAQAGRAARRRVLSPWGDATCGEPALPCGPPRRSPCWRPSPAHRQ
jgi:hypothetical protein